jgi:hypothetical protein
MDLILVFPPFYLSVYLNFNRSGAAGNLIWFSSSPPNRLHSFGNVKYSPGKICPPYQKLKTRPERAAAAASLPLPSATLQLPQPHFRFRRNATTSSASLPRMQIHFPSRRFTSAALHPIPRNHFLFCRLASAS